MQPCTARASTIASRKSLPRTPNCGETRVRQRDAGCAAEPAFGRRLIGRSVSGVGSQLTIVAITVCVWPSTSARWAGRLLAVEPYQTGCYVSLVVWVRWLGMAWVFARAGDRKEVPMPDGDNLILGRDNTAESLTRLKRTAPGGDEDPLEAFIIDNPHGSGLLATAGGSIGTGVSGTSPTGPGVLGFSSSTTHGGVQGHHSSGPGVVGVSGTGVGVQGTCANHIGVRGDSDNHVGMRGRSQAGIGIRGSSAQQSDDPFSGGIGVHGIGTNGATGVAGTTQGGIGVLGSASGGFAGLFQGNVSVTGTLSASGKTFKIDHPLDPENRYLVHAVVESSDMKTMYDGVVTLDHSGAASVSLPEWFEALNKDYCYQLTCVGAPAPELHITEEIADNHFAIGGGPPGAKICWQVTGIRQDSWAIANPVSVEQDKRTEERTLQLYAEPVRLMDAFSRWIEEDQAEADALMSAQRQTMIELQEQAEGPGSPGASST